MKNKLVPAIALLTLHLGLGYDAALADSRRVRCPVVVDRETGKFSSSRAKYRCYERSRDARRQGFSQHSFDDSSCSPTPAPTPPGGGVTGDFTLSGPGQRESVVFDAPNGGSVTYLFPGGGEFEVKVFNASTEKRVQELVETTQAGSGSIEFTGQSFPVFVKVEGPGAWSVGIDLN